MVALKEDFLDLRGGRHLQFPSLILHAGHPIVDSILKFYLPLRLSRRIIIPKKNPLKMIRMAAL